MRKREIALRLNNNSNSAKAIAEILKKTPKHSVDNVLLEALSIIKADTKLYSEIILKAKSKLLDNRTRYVMIHKELLQ